MEMQPKTNHNYLFAVLLQAKMNIIQEHTHNVWTSSQFHNHSLVSRGHRVPLSRTSLLSFLNDTCTQWMYTGSLQTTLSVGQFALLACWEPDQCLFFPLDIASDFHYLFPQPCACWPKNVDGALEHCFTRLSRVFEKWNVDWLWLTTLCVCVFALGLNLFSSHNLGDYSLRISS